MKVTWSGILSAVSEEEIPVLGYFQDTKTREPDLLSSLTDCHGELCVLRESAEPLWSTK